MGLEVGAEGEEEEKIPLCESIGHRGRCPALPLNYNHDLPKQGTDSADHLTLLPLLFLKYSRFACECKLDWLPASNIVFAMYPFVPPAQYGVKQG